jgi:hypothetical protein
MQLKMLNNQEIGLISSHELLMAEKERDAFLSFGNQLAFS